MKKIMFNDRYGLTESVLKGRKTMTRRIIPLDIYNATDWKVFEEGDIECYGTGEGDWVDIRRAAAYQVGEVVAVAQSGESIFQELQKRFGDTSDAALSFKEMYEGMPMWTNKMFTPADLCPNQIQLTDVNVERLQDISDEDCMREGIKKSMWMDVSGKQIYGFDPNEDKWSSPRDAFAALIDKISGKGTWKRNPWVFAYTFELVK